MIDFSHPHWRELARQLLDHSPLVIRARQYLPLVGLLKDNQLLLALGNHRYELTPAGRRYLTRELMLAELACAPPEPEEWLHAQGWQLGERVNERVLAALYRKGEASFSPVEQINFEDKGIRLCSDLPLRLRAARPFSLFFSGGTLLDAAPWLHTLGEVALPARTLAGLGKILWGEGEIQRVISTDSVGVFAELSLPDDALLVWLPAQDPGALQPLIAALPPQAGVIALFAGLLCYGLLGSSRFAIVSATSSSAAVLAAATLSLAEGDVQLRGIAHMRSIDAAVHNFAALRENAGLPAVQRLAWFNHGFMGAAVVDDTLQLSDLRMGNEPDYFFRFAVAQRAGPRCSRSCWPAASSAAWCLA